MIKRLWAGFRRLFTRKKTTAQIMLEALDRSARHKNSKEDAAPPKTGSAGGKPE